MVEDPLEIPQGTALHYRHGSKNKRSSDGKTGNQAESFPAACKLLFLVM